MGCDKEYKVRINGRKKQTVCIMYIAGSPPPPILAGRLAGSIGLKKDAPQKT
jgi:hypothetical protein